MSNDESTPTVPQTPTPTPLTEESNAALPETMIRGANRKTDPLPALPDPTLSKPQGSPNRADSDPTVVVPNELVSGYEILSELGKGGMGVVYKARHVKLNRVVALKMMLGGELAHKSDLFRFLAEAEAVAAIKHDNVVQVFDYGETNNKPFMALEFCAGGTLAKLLPKSKEQAIHPREMAALIAKVARGVAAAHALGIVHRDLKPGNVLLDESGVPKVADFGLAKRGEGADVTQAGAVMGTPAYMAPEQARDAKFVGPQADVWGLGVMLYESLTGMRPFTGTSLEVMVQAQESDPIPPRRHVYSIPLDLELICLKCLSKAPHERYATAKELADDLDRFARGEAISVRPLGTIERAYKWIRRNRVVTAAVVAVCLALAVGAGISLNFGLEAQRQAEDAKNKKQLADEATLREKGETERAERERNLAIAARNELKEKNEELAQSQVRVNLMLAKALLGPLSAVHSNAELSVYEKAAITQLANAHHEPVAWMFFEEAIRTPLTCKQFECRAEYLFQSVVGLDPVRRKVADAAILAKFRDPKTEPEVRLSLAHAVTRSGYHSESTPDVIRILTEEFADLKSAHNPVDITQALLAVAPAMTPAERERVLALLLSDNRRVTGDSLVALVDALTERLPPAEKRRVCETIIKDYFSKPFDDNDSFIDVDTLSPVVRAYSHHLELDDVAKRSLNIVRALPKRTSKQELVVSLLILTARLQPQEAATLHASAAKALATAYDKEMEVGTRQDLARLFGMVAHGLSPAEAQKYARAYFALMKTETETQLRGTHAQMFAAVAPRLDATEAARTAPAIWGLLVKEQDTTAFYGFGTSLIALAPQFSPKLALKFSQDILTALKTNQEFSYYWPALLLVLESLLPQLETADRARIGNTFGTLVSEIAANDNPTAVRWMMQGVTRVLPYLDRGVAVKLGTQATRIFLEAITQPIADDRQQKVAFEQKVAFAEAGLWLLPFTAPEEAAKIVAVAVPMLRDKLSKVSNDSYQRHDLAKWLADISVQLPVAEAQKVAFAIAEIVSNEIDPSMRRRLAGYYVAVVLRVSPTTSMRAQLATLAPPPGCLWPAFGVFPLSRPALPPLPVESVIEVLKHPFSVSEARRAALDALEVIYNRKFRDQWEFVEYAKQHQPQLDLRLPAKK